MKEIDGQVKRRRFLGQVRGEHSISQEALREDFAVRQVDLFIFDVDVDFLRDAARQVYGIQRMDVLAWA